MRSPSCTLDPQDIYRYAATVLQHHLQWRDYGPKCTVTTLFQILFVCRRPTLCAVCAETGAVGASATAARRSCTLRRNLWGWLQGSCLATPRHGGRRLTLHTLRFKTLLTWLTHLAEEVFGLNDSVLAE
jgi:hypothetical protein